MTATAIIQAVTGLLSVLSSMGINARELFDTWENASREGRDVSAAEVDEFAQQARAAGRSAQQAIDSMSAGGDDDGGA